MTGVAGVRKTASYRAVISMWKATLAAHNATRMTGGTFFRGGFVEKNGPIVNQPHRCVTTATGCLAMGALQGKNRSLVVEQRRLPLGAVVAVATTGPTFGDELPAVYVGVASSAPHWDSSEIHIGELDFRGLWLVTADAMRVAVRPEQWERGLRMVEAGKFRPRLRRVASLASPTLAINAGLPHELVKMPLVWVRVASGASHTLPVICGGGFGPELGGLFVTVAARYRHMAAGQGHPCLFMPVRSECRRPVSLQGVALFALVEVRRNSKLPGMRIAVAIRTELKLHPVDRLLAPRNVTLRAL